MEGEVTFGRRLKERRKALDLTQDALARQVGCALSTIKKIEEGALRPSRQVAERLADQLDLPPEERVAFVRLARQTPPIDRPARPRPPAFVPVERGPRPDSGQVVRGYELREQIGSGGFGAVYLAYQPGVGREVAVKIILPQYANHPEFIRRFEAEAQFVARLEHPHIVPLYDYWREPDRAYLVMRYIRGGSLQATLQRGPLALDATTRLLEQIGAALAVAHRHGVIHRDLKPPNILLDEDGSAYLADFGIAKDLGDATPADQTQPGAILGSPAYLSPEQIKDELVTPQTDIYSLGLLLYEILTGVKPFQSLTPEALLQQQLHDPLPALPLDLPAGLDAVIQRATAKRPADRYADVLDMVGSFQQAVARVSWGAPLSARAASERPLTTAQEPQINDNPYKGLRAFAEADADDFFGRESLTQRLLERMAEESVVRGPLSVAADDRQWTTDHGPRTTSRFLAVVGPSGSGKSSVVRAGLVPALRRGGLPGSEHWFIVEVIPGAHPLEEIEAALLRVAVNPPASLLEQLRADARGLLRAVKRVLPQDEETELVLVIDQFEELFTLVEEEAARAHLLDSLVAAVTDERSRVRVVITLRADFFDRPLLYAGLSELVRERTEVVVPLTADELRQAISGPAARAGLSLEPDLVATIERDVGAQPGALPLLQYALTELFERREGCALTLAAYQASGGVLGALGRRAEALYAGLDRAEQDAARQLFLRLIMLGEGVEDTRRRVRRAELEALTKDEGRMRRPMFVLPPSSAMDTVIDAYGRYRLLTFDRDPVTRGPTVEVAHEALLRTWGRLREWLDASREQLRVQRRLMASAAEWAGTEQDASFLASGARLAQFEALAADGALALTADEDGYLQASLAERDRQTLVERDRQAHELELARQSAQAQRSAANRLRYLASALALFLLVAGGLAAFALNSRAGALANFTRADRLRLASEANAALDRGESGELPALLALRSLQSGYTTPADTALLRALQNGFTRQRFVNRTGGVPDVAFSPDGRYVLTASALVPQGSDNTARLWDVQTGQELRVFKGHSDQVGNVAFSPDGRYVLTGSFDGTTQLSDAQTGQELQVFYTGRTNSVVFSPDGKYVLTGSDDQIARLWDAQTGQELRAFTGHKGGVNGVAFSPDGKYVLTGGLDKTARLWDAQTGREILQFSGHTDVVSGVAFSPDGKYVLTGSYDKTARLWNAQTGLEIRQFSGHSDHVTDVVFSPDGRYVLTSSDDKTARLWDAQTGQELRVLTGHTDVVQSVAFSPDGKFVLTGSRDATVRLWDIPAEHEPRTFVGHADVVEGVTFSPDGKYILTGSWDKTVRLWDAQTGEQLRTFHGACCEVIGVAFSPDGKYVLAGNAGNDAQLWDAQTGQLLRVFTGHTDAVLRVKFSPDGKYALSGSYDKTARLWDVQTGRELRVFIGHTGIVYGVAFSPNGRFVLTAGDTTARLWDAQTGQELRVFKGHTSIVTNVAFAPDGRFVLTAGDTTARLWDVQTGREVRQFSGNTSVLVGQVAFSPDGKYVLTGSDDKIARLWDAQTGQEIRQFSGHTNAIWAVAFSPDGKYILTSGGADKIVRLWHTDYHDVIELACAQLPRDFTDEERKLYSIADNAPTCPRS